MNGQLWWKEYRTLRGPWCWSGGVMLVCFSLYRLVSGPESEAAYAIAWIGAAVFGLVATASVVAGEYEGGTWPLLERLPVSRRELWLTKLGAAAAAQGLFLLVMTFFAFMADGLPTLSPWLALETGIENLEALMWGMLLSSVLRRSLLAVLAAGIAIVVQYFLLMLAAEWLFSPVQRNAWSLTNWWYVRLLLALAALGGSLLIFRWHEVRRVLALARG